MAIIKRFKIKNFKQDQNIFELKNVSKSFGKRKVLDDVSINVKKGEILGVLGPNGAGKSTILKIAMGIYEPDTGSILINNSNVTKQPIYERAINKKISYIPQVGGAILDLTVEENLLMVAEIHISDKPLRISKVSELISQFQFEPVVKVKAKNISGGQFKRLIIAMALINEPKIMLLDEIFSALDLKTIAMLKELILNLQSFRSITCIMVDHLARDLLEVSNRCLILSDGKIVAEGKAEEIIKNRLAQEVYFGDEFKLS
ncbi:ATP-binding cassette domain-containing protein [Candidatus Pelagibacter sp.]|nr:ATP-binding cassette domain-containing protein [Candidatus Pelagibacter sp.]|tara:strand:+ start:6 stop:782 length:777 start_codon:yes stop_codon:yes gene_type:complete